MLVAWSRPGLVTRAVPSGNKKGARTMPGIADSYDKHSAMGKGKMKKPMMKGKKSMPPKKGKVGMGEAGALKSYMRRTY